MLPKPRNSKPDSADEVSQGRVLWLPRQRNKPASQIIVRTVRSHCDNRIHRVLQTIFDHPVVVVSRSSAEPSTVHFLLMTTFGGKPVSKVFNQRKEDPADYLPLGPANHVAGLRERKDYQPLSFINNARMRRSGFVQLDKVYEVPWEDLENTWLVNGVKVFRLDEISLARLLYMTQLRSSYVPDEQYREPRPMLPHFSVPGAFPPLPSSSHVRRNEKSMRVQAATAWVSVVQRLPNTCTEQWRVQRCQLSYDIDLWEDRE